MINKRQIKYLVKKRDSMLNDAQVDARVDSLFNEIFNENYDFSKYTRTTLTQQRKKRQVYNYEKLSCEDILCQYLKKQLDTTFHIKYASRNKIINLLFNVLPVIKDMNDFVIVRADFKSFFDTVLIKEINNNYIQSSSLKRYDKELINEYIKEFKYCHAGLCLSNGMTEIICRDFDQRIKTKLIKYGVFFYERYVDDIFLLMNKYISEDKFLEIVNSTIKEVFGDSPVRLSSESEKFTYIARRNIKAKRTEKIIFLGYEFELFFCNENTINFKYGISEKKRKKHSNIIRRALLDYSRNGNIELLRQRIKINSARIIISKPIEGYRFEWLTKGIVANYNELQHHMNRLTKDTEGFLKSVYYKLFSQYKIPIPHFVKPSKSQASIYNLFSNVERNRTIIFHESIGVSRETLVKWIRKIEPSYRDVGENYNRIVLYYLDLIK